MATGRAPAAAGARLLALWPLPFPLGSRAAQRGPRYFSHNGGGGGGRARRGKNLLLALG